MNKKLKYIKLADEIESKIKSGQFKPGEKLKTEREWIDEYKVSKMTIRHAFNTLIQRNLIINHYHQGYFVSNFGIHRNNEILGCTELFERRGLKIYSKVIRLEKVLPNIKTKELLQLKDGQEVFQLDRIRYAKGEPVLIEKSNIVADKVPDLDMFNFETFSLYDIMFKHYDIIVSFAKDDISADLITGTDAQILLNKKSGPALIVDNLAYDQKGEPIELTRSIYNYKIFSYKVVSNQVTKRYQLSHKKGNVTNK